MPLINISNPVQDDLTKEWTVKAGKVSYKLTRPTVSTPALQFLDYIAYECRRTGKASFEMDIRDYAAFKKRSTAKSALQRLQEEVYAQMQEVANIEFKVLEVVDGKEKEIGQIKIGGGTIIAPTRGKMRINLNQDLVSYLYILAPTDYPAQLFTVDPRTSTYYFGRYIAANWRMNEGKPGREKKILMRTLVAQSPNLPTYDAVMKGNRDLTGRIVKKTFNDLDALDALYYDFYTADGKHIEDTEALDYNTFINGYIIAEYFDIQQHPERVQAKLDRQKKITAAKEKAQAKAAAKKAAAGNA